MRISSLALGFVLGVAIAASGGGSPSEPLFNISRAGAASIGSLRNATVGPVQRRTAASVVSASPYSALVLRDGPIAYYPLGDWGPKVVDASRNGLNGTYGRSVRHGAYFLTSSGDHSAMFAGSPAGSDVAANSASVVADPLFSSASVTIEAWIRANDWNRTGNVEPLVSYGRDVQGEAWIIELTSDSSLQFYMKTSGGARYYLLKSPLARIVPGQVYQVVATYNGAGASMYVNGTFYAGIPASGALDYTGIQRQYGLAIGGALGGARPIFNGAISNVSIYPAALAPAEIENHFITGQLQSVASEKPSPSDAFVDSVGVNTHITGSATAYNNPWSTFMTLIRASGIRHIRDGLTSTPNWYVQHINELGAVGIHADLIGRTTLSSSALTTILSAFGNSVESVEGLNEPDLSGLQTSVWTSMTRLFQQTLWSAVKGKPATAKIQVLGPTIVWESHALALGNLSAYMDRANVHKYFGSFNPGTTGWGPLDQYGIYGSIQDDMAITAIVSGAKPIWVTETGYPDGGQYGVDDQVQSRYIPRILLEHFINGIYRSELYQFYDDTNTNFSGNFGLVTVNHVPKPQYYAVQNLIRKLSDPGSPVPTAVLRFILAGNTSNVQHLLLQRRDGTYELVIWVETESYDPVAHVDLTVPAQTVTFRPGYRPSAANISTIGDTGAMTTSSISFVNGMATFAVTDHVTILSFR